MGEWLKTLVAYMMIVSISMQMIPNKKYEQYVRLFTGFLLLVFAIQPILKIGSMDSYMENKLSEFLNDQKKLEQEIGRESDLFLRESMLSDEQENLKIEIQEIEKIEVMVGD